MLSRDAQVAVVRHNGESEGLLTRSPSDAGRRIVAFYEDSAPDDRGRFRKEILQFGDEQLEEVHDFVQWLFPLPEQSGANPSAPILDAAAIAAFRSRPELRAALLRSFERMLAFYGLQWSGERIIKSASFAERGGWLYPGNHNHLRLTRILRSLTVLGEPQAARALFDVLSEIYYDEHRCGRDRISDRTFAFWRAAIAG